MNNLWIVGIITLGSILALCYYRVYLPRQMYRWHRHSLKAFARAIELRTHGRFGNPEQLAELALEVGRLIGLSASRLQRLELAVYLRDIGMVGVPYAILNKEEPLTPIERITLERHVEISSSIIEQIPVLYHLAPLVRLHHVHYGEHPNAPLEAHILSALSDLFEITVQQGADMARHLLSEGAGTRYHPQVVETIEAVLLPAPSALLEAVRRSAALW